MCTYTYKHTYTYYVSTTCRYVCPCRQEQQLRHCYFLRRITFACPECVPPAVFSPSLHSPRVPFSSPLPCSFLISSPHLHSPCPRRISPNTLAHLGRGDDTVGNPHRTQIVQFELFELILLLKLEAPCRAIRGNSISVNSTLSPLLTSPRVYEHATRSQDLCQHCSDHRVRVAENARTPARPADCNYCNCNHKLLQNLY